MSRYAYETVRENPQVTRLTFTCSKSTMETLEKCLKSIQSSEAYLEPNRPFFLLTVLATSLIVHICSTRFSIPRFLKLMIKTPEKRHNVILVSLLFTLNIFCTLVFMHNLHRYRFHKFMFPLF